MDEELDSDDQRRRQQHSRQLGSKRATAVQVLQVDGRRRKDHERVQVVVGRVARVLRWRRKVVRKRRVQCCGRHKQAGGTIRDETSERGRKEAELGQAASVALSLQSSKTQ